MSPRVGRYGVAAALCVAAATAPGQPEMSVDSPDWQIRFQVQFMFPK